MITNVVKLIVADVCSILPGEIRQNFKKKKKKIKTCCMTKTLEIVHIYKTKMWMSCLRETDTTGWVTKGPKIQMQKSGWIWSQTFLRWGDSTSPHRIFTLLILWHIVISCSPTSLVNFHFWWMAEVVCEQQDFFFPAPRFPPRGPEWESIKRFTCCRVAVYVTC